MIPLFRPEYDASEVTMIADSLASRWSGLGPKVQAFEKRFAQLCGASHAVAVNSCTSALELAYRWLRRKSIHTATIPSLTFCSTAQAALRAGLGVKFVDVNPLTFCRHIGEQEEDEKNGHVHVIVHYGGRRWTADAPNILHDCAHCSPLEFQQPPDGICCWSFEAKKIISTGDGGMITTNDEEAADKFRSWRWCGISRSTWDRMNTTGYAWDYEINENGVKCHMNDLTAAIGLAQMDKLEQMQRDRKRVYDAYSDLLRDGRGKVVHLKHEADSGKSLFVIRVPNRAQVIDALKEKGITTGVHYKPLHLHRAFDNCRRGDLTNTMQLYDEIITLPMFPSLTDEQVGVICQEVLAHAIH